MDPCRLNPSCWWSSPFVILRDSIEASVSLHSWRLSLLCSHRKCTGRNYRLLPYKTWVSWPWGSQNRLFQNRLEKIDFVTYISAVAPCMHILTTIPPRYRLNQHSIWLPWCRDRRYMQLSEILLISLQCHPFSIRTSSFMVSGFGIIAYKAWAAGRQATSLYFALNSSSYNPFWFTHRSNPSVLEAPYVQRMCSLSSPDYRPYRV